ncbi:MAG: hypothetical protein WCX96_05185 [Bacilli bacterium]
MADNTFLVSVARAIGLNPTTQEAIFYGRANLRSAFNLTMQSTDIRGDIGNALLYKHMHDRDLEVNVEQAVFEKTFLALNVGSSILNQTVNVLKTECITLDTNVGTLTETPVGNVSVIKDDGTIVTITPSGSSITVAGGGNTKVTAIYRYSDTIDRVSVSTETPPEVITLILIAEVRNSKGVLVEELQIEVPSFQISGNYNLEMSAEGVSQEALNGMALAVDGTTCADGSIYAYVSWIPVTTTTISVASIAITPDRFEPAVADLPATQQITVTGIRGGVYGTANVTSDCTFTKLSGDTDITVSASGLITVANTGTAADSAIIEAEYDGLTDIILVEVQE